MPEQLFDYMSGSYTLLIGAKDEREARAMLSRYLDEHPMMPRYEDWALRQICGKLAYGIFSQR